MRQRGLQRSPIERTTSEEEKERDECACSTHLSVTTTVAMHTLPWTNLQSEFRNITARTICQDAGGRRFRAAYESE